MNIINKIFDSIKEAHRITPKTPTRIYLGRNNLRELSKELRTEHYSAYKHNSAGPHEFYGLKIFIVFEDDHFFVA